MSPHDIFEQPDFADAALNLTCDLIGRLVVAVRIMPPGDKQRWSIDVLDAFDDVADRLFRALRLNEGHAPIREDAGRRRLGEGRETQIRLQPVESLPPRAGPEVDLGDVDLLAGCEPAPSLTMTTRGRTPFRAGRGDQSSAAKAFVIGMGSDDEQLPPLPKPLAQRAKLGTMRGLQEFAGRHRHRSCASRGCARTEAAALTGRDRGLAGEERWRDRARCVGSG